ncbi:MAG: hypothetical protein EOO88_40420, partial [Pedobacter sp.]
YRKVPGWKPVYEADTINHKLTFFPTPKAMAKPGKIYVKGNIIYQNDIGSGIHIIDNSDPLHAHTVAFMKLPGNTDIAIKGNYIYANNFDDLVVIDINDASAPVEVHRLKHSFSANNFANPYVWQVPPEPGYYECPAYYTDSTIVRWTLDSVYNMCYKN